MKTVARFVTRLQEPGDGLFIGALLKSGEGVFKPNTVYEIRETLGELRIQEVGMATGCGPENCASNMRGAEGTQFSWNRDIASLLEENPKTFFLTRGEYTQLADKRNEGELK